jgi:hypothetical protein|tara:strand:- start:402 stop:674 length:273 start_codon:yes stop_codon:yes gene_type:complete
MSILKLLLAYINMMVPAPSEEWDTHQLPSHDNHYLTTHISGRWFEKVIDKEGRPIYICNSEHHRYLIEWQDGKPFIKYKAPNGWKWVKLN